MLRSSAEVFIPRTDAFSQPYKTEGKECDSRIGQVHLSYHVSVSDVGDQRWPVTSGRRTCLYGRRTGFKPLFIFMLNLKFWAWWSGVCLVIISSSLVSSVSHGPARQRQKCFAVEETDWPSSTINQTTIDRLAVVSISNPSIQQNNNKHHHGIGRNGKGIHTRRSRKAQFRSKSVGYYWECR